MLLSSSFRNLYPDSVFSMKTTQDNGVVFREDTVVSNELEFE